VQQMQVVHYAPMSDF